MRLFLIRHGQTPANVAGELDTAPPGAGLTDLGHRQAAAVVTALAGERIAGVYASPLVRTQLTAEPLAHAHGLDVRVQPGLEEVRAGDLEMRTDEDAVAAYLGTLAGWMLGDLDRRMPGSHDGHAFLERYDAAVRAIAGRHRADDTVVAVSHGAAIRTWSAVRVSDLDAAAVTERRVMNTGGVLLAGDPDAGWRLERWSSEPLGGADLADRAAHDVTGDGADEALAEAEHR
ncbi:MAG TPA: histidine phosphatase family protein [Nocardioides sp.]|nr:histidine phosphatase family protein [Nocardioides sp.]